VKQKKIEMYLKDMGVDVFPITLMKLLINRKKIVNWIRDFGENIKNGKIKITDEDYEKCEFCKASSQRDRKKCRAHISLDRIKEDGKSIIYDEATSLFIYKNEMYKFIDGHLLIIYTPHTKTLKTLESQQVRKIDPYSFSKNIKVSEPKRIVEIDSNIMMEEMWKCWFNQQFSIITLPEEGIEEDKEKKFLKWGLVLNK